MRLTTIEISGICHAYESGMGRGMSGRDLAQPYDPESPDGIAYAHGWAQGLERFTSALKEAPIDIQDDAKNWHALINCARMTTLGSAGIHPMSDTYDDAHGHLTLNLWTHISEGWGLGSDKDQQDQGGRRDLLTFIRKARDAQGT